MLHNTGKSTYPTVRIYPASSIARGVKEFDKKDLFNWYEPLSKADDIPHGNHG